MLFNTTILKTIQQFLRNTTILKKHVIGFIYKGSSKNQNGTRMNINVVHELFHLRALAIFAIDRVFCSNVARGGVYNFHSFRWQPDSRQCAQCTTLSPHAIDYGDPKSYLVLSGEGLLGSQRRSHI